jgi:hypothetical protein
MQIPFGVRHEQRPKVRNISTDGVTFPATQAPSSDANTLDDYEEGTTTPTVAAGGGAFTSVSGTVRYTKAGNRVNATVTVGITTNGTANAYVLVPMPLSAAETTAHSGVDASAITSLTGYITGSSLLIYKDDGTYPGADGKTLIVQCSYRV